VNSHELRERDILYQLLGERAAVRSVTFRPARTPVASLTVARLHTFAVGPAAVLVHNMAHPKKSAT
jgi:hypothetical protein